MSDARPTVLVVDDAEINIDVLLETLGGDYTVRGAVDGASALRGIRKSLPDLILLDVRMPGMDGFEVCRRLKDDPATRDIPIIFLTVLTEEVDEARGLDLGAVDYIVKPFHPAVVKARVRNHLQLKAHRDELEALVERRSRELAEAHSRLQALDAARHDFLCVISHELRTPANGVLGIAELALMGINDREMQEQYSAMLADARHRLIATLDAALRLAELQDDDASIVTVPVDMSAVVTAAWASLRESFSAQQLSFVPPTSHSGSVLGNDAFLRDSVTALMKVAREMALPGTTVTAQFGDDGNRTTLVIGFEASPLSDALQRTFFSTFSRNRSCSLVENLGLDVPLTAHVVRAMGGSVDIRNVACGVEIRLTLPKAGLEGTAR